ncbi:hypothetical protein ONZ45_g18791 [Pleurotus djamor]|nr:hypothetical protein ONZ45_g18791 [Pleurotus djamor]
MSTSSSRTSSLGSSSPRSSSPVGLAQPDHFYGADPSQPPQPSAFKAWLTPEDDPFAHRGIPIFKPSMEEFKDFEGYMTRVEAWGARSGIIKIIPPQEWTSALPSVKVPLQQVKIKSPIEQHMLGRGGLFRQENVEKRKFMSVREWAELCHKEDFRAPGVDEVGRHARAAIVPKKPKRGKKNTDDEVDDVSQADSLHQPTDAHSTTASTMATPEVGTSSTTKQTNKQRPRRQGQTREAREASLADKAARDLQFVEAFDPHQDWLPPNTKASDYTPDFCHSLERHYWRNCGLAKPAWYGADSQGSLFTDETKHWNVAHLDSALSRLLPASDHGLPGVNTPYLYFGMWRATFAWHVEDMDLFSINYIHFGAPKFWYAVPQGRADALERIMREYFPKDTSQCPQFLRHKSFLASPTLLAQSACRPNHLVQHAGEIVITFPRGYHAGFNLGFNCAESVNFALDSWLEMGKQAKVCECVSDSVRIDVAQLLLDRALEAAAAAPPLPKLKLKKPSNKRKAISDHPPTKAKKVKTESATLSLGSEPAPTVASTAQPAKKLHITLKLGPKPVGAESYPCCLCASTNEEGLLRVHAPPLGKREAVEAAHDPKVWRAHELCASVIPETWVDEMDSADGVKTERVIYGVDAIVKDRWNLKCSACTKTRDKVHGAPIQCTKGKCPKAFHVSCAKDGAMHGIVFEIVKDVEKEVVLVGPNPSATSMTDPLSFSQMAVDHGPPPDVLKIIKKVEVQALCPQHNPTLAAAKKANKQDRIKNDLLALPTMARIKIRVSAGVFEVSLIRVIEETGSVEVLWDRGLKREFKWGSVVFGSTDGPIQQKPSEIAAVPQGNATT